MSIDSVGFIMHIQLTFTIVTCKVGQTDMGLVCDHSVQVSVCSDYRHRQIDNTLISSL